MKKQYKDRVQMQNEIEREDRDRISKQAEIEGFSRAEFIVQIFNEHMKQKEENDLNDLAHKTALDGMNGTKVLEDYLFDLVTKDGEEMEIALPNIYFCIQLNEESTIDLVIYKKVDGKRVEEQIDTSELESRLNQWLVEREKDTYEVLKDENHLNTYER